MAGHTHTASDISNDRAGEPWMALPLFNRLSSPERTQDPSVSTSRDNHSSNITNGLLLTQDIGISASSSDTKSNHDDTEPSSAQTRTYERHQFTEDVDSTRTQTISEEYHLNGQRAASVPASPTHNDTTSLTTTSTTTPRLRNASPRSLRSTRNVLSTTHNRRIQRRRPNARNIHGRSLSLPTSHIELNGGLHGSDQATDEVNGEGR